MKKCKTLFHFLLFAFAAISLAAATASAQVELKYLSVGSLRSWFASSGCEVEVSGFVKSQQDGLEWPAYYQYQDVQAAKGFWIGTTNFTDQSNTTFPYKVVHVGPRVDGTGEFYPVKFEMISKFEPPKTFVDGELTRGNPVINNSVDPTLPCDRMIVNEVNTAIGITMTRKILAFSQGFHDNYFIYEYTFKNTGNANADPTIELPNKTLTGLYFYWQYRYSVCKESRYVIGNSSGWGINTMIDTRGDGAAPPVTFFPGNRDNDIRAQYSWHGRHPQSITTYDNIGASVWTAPQSRFEPFSDRNDTSGRLTAPQFVGVATIHADRSSTNHTDDPTQPSTTTYEGSDDPLNFNNDQFNGGKMAAEYDWMRKGHMSPRHADKVGPTGDPSQGFNSGTSTGGQSVANGYGPYTLAPGDSVRIVMVEAVAGLGREKAISVGQRFKNGTKFGQPYPAGITAAQKNDSVYTGRDSLFQTFRRAIANYRANYQIPSPPLPPKSFDVNGLGDRIELKWVMPSGGPSVTGFRVYRSVGKSDGLYEKITPTDLPASATVYNDTTAIRGVGYYYYIVAVGNPADNNRAGDTPAGALVSNRAYAQSFLPATLKRPAGPGINGSIANSALSAIRIVPNPYILSSNENILRFPGEKDKLAFFNIPGRCTIKIYTELGELIYTIEHTNGTGDEYWNSVTSSNQVIVSGVYIALIEDLVTGGRVLQKFVVIR